MGAAMCDSTGQCIIKRIIPVGPPNEKGEGDLQEVTRGEAPRKSVGWYISLFVYALQRFVFN